MKLVKFSSTPKAIVSSLPQLTRPAEFGTVTLDKRSSSSLGTKMIFSLVLSTMKVIL
mgnify:CR=1 FL=1